MSIDAEMKSILRRERDESVAKLNIATGLLKRLVGNTEEGPTGDPEWWRDYFLFTGQHMILTEEGWQPGEEKSSCEEADINIFDEVNAPFI